MCAKNVARGHKGEGRFGLLTFVLLAASAASVLGEIIPADRRIDWSSAGVSIPSASWPIFQTVSPGGSIQAAVNACPVGQVVKLAAGTHNLSSTVTVTKGIVIRGAGTGSKTGEALTTINFTGSDPAFNFGPYGVGGSPDVPPHIADLTSGYNKGSTNLVVSGSLSTLVVGREVVIDQLNDGTIANNQGNEGACTYCSRSNGTRSMAQRAIVTAKNGQTVTIDTPLYFTFSAGLSPQITWFDQPSVQNAGLEDLKIDNTNGGTGTNYTVAFDYATRCWIRNIRTEKGPRAHIQFRAAYHCTLRDSYITLGKTSGSSSYGLEMHHTSSANLIENNIFYQTTAPIMNGWSISGNVEAYNFIEQVVYTPQSWLPQSIGFHDAHAMFNLVEGNISPNMYADFVHGSASHQTLLRNRIYGWQALGPSESNTNAIGLESHNTYYNVVGNVLGTTGKQTHYQIIAPASITEFNVYKLGYFGTYTVEPRDNNVAATLLRHGNWDTFTNAIVWDSGISDHTIPSSYYLASKPSWFGNLAWPPVDPTNPAAFTNTNIPAGYRFINRTDPPPGPSPTPTPTPTPTPPPTPTPTPTPTPQPTPTPTPFGLSFPSTSGVITAPFVINGDDTISQSIQVVDPTQGGKGLYSFTIPKSDNYIIFAEVNCPDGGSNSFFVNIDAEPSATMIWDIPITSGLEVRKVTWNSSTTPQVWALSAGTHQLIVRGREANSKLGQITIALEDLPLPPENLHIIP